MLGCADQTALCIGDAMAALSSHGFINYIGLQVHNISTVSCCHSLL